VPPYGTITLGEKKGRHIDPTQKEEEQNPFNLIMTRFLKKKGKGGVSDATHFPFIIHLRRGERENGI